MARMSEIFFIRHAETDMAGTFCGHSNPSLNLRGRDQLSQLLHALDTESIHAVYASDLLRAQETAAAIATSRGIECHLRPALREINFGRWEGLTWDEVEVEHTDTAYAQRWINEYPNLPAPDGESFRDFENRVLDEMGLLMMKAKEHDIAVVTHAGVLRIVLCRLCGRSEDEAWEQTKSYCSIIRYTVPISPLMESVEVGS
jgi:alpha-ribazole phosphatase